MPAVHLQLVGATPAPRFWTVRALLASVALCGLSVSTALAQTLVAGQTPGNFSVAQTGAATYSIPIQVPPGVAGMEPKFSLNYDSQSGNGIMGMGWNLDGVSTIERCAATQATDGVVGSVKHQTSDKFCMDGKRLMVIAGVYGAAGSEYRTEIDNFSKITANGEAGGNAANGPESFTVRTQRGLVLEYGSSTDARIEAQNKEVVATWALKTMRDVMGNEVDYSYTEDNASGTWNLDTVSYAGRSVQFSYEARPDVSNAYQAGSLLNQSLRLKEINTRIGAQVIQRTIVNYSSAPSTLLSMVESVQVCDGGNHCLKPVDFGWSESSGKLGAWKSYSPNTGAGSFDLDKCKLLQPTDMNADGLMDMVCVYAYSDGTNKTFVQLNNGGSLNSWASYSPRTNVGSFNLDRCKLLGAADVNGDGIVDLVCAYSYDDDTNAVFAQIGTGSGLTAWQSYAVRTGVGLSHIELCKILRAVDVNGDGLSDLLCVFAYSNGTTRTLVNINNGASLNGWIAYSPRTEVGSFNLDVCKSLDAVDMNGDGLADVMCMYAYSNGTNRVFVQLNNGVALDGWHAYSPRTAVGSFNIDRCELLTPADMNGDGLVDIVCAYTYSDVTNRTFVQLNNGEGLNGWTSLSSRSSVGGFDMTTCKSLRVSDINGDGLPEVVCAYEYGDVTNKTLVQVNNGVSLGDWSSYSPRSEIQNVKLNRCKVLQPVDMDGNGIADMVCAYGYANTSATTFIQPDSRTGVLRIESFGPTERQVVVSYSTLSKKAEAPQGPVYSKDSDALFPMQDVQVPLQVVASTSQSNGVGGVNTTNYSYGGLKMEHASGPGRGRGSLGFRWMRGIEDSTGLETYAEYAQNWPYVGQAVLSETRKAGSGNGGLLRRSVSTLGCYQTTAATATAGCPANSTGLTYFVFPQMVTESSWDLNGAVMPVLTTTTNYQGTSELGGSVRQFGDATSIQSDILQGGALRQRKLTVNEFHPAKTSGTDWQLGRLKRATVTSSQY